MSITVGSKGRAECVVTQETTAAAVGSGLLPVFATPQMIALMEGAAVDAVQAGLEEGQGTVGTHLDVSHDAATPIGMRVWAEAELTAVEGRKLTFAVTAFDEAGPIGKGVHERFIIQNDRFLSKTEAKKAAQ
ncbi:thioesterase family protein [Flavonifractor hominis]|uniref:Thioesterase family protein n=1 Tax=Flavonifractor hominis TaxID=3133178 RepID=A0ABV1EKZ2_9FIRM